VNPALGNRPLDGISRGEIRRLLLRLHKRGLSRGTVSIVKDVISGVMGYAVDEDIISTDPTIGITKRLNLTRRRKADPQPLTPEEVDLFLDTCQKHYPQHYPFFLCAFRTGMRLGELLALQWGDIDWHGRLILVRRSFKGGKVSGTKTGRTRRVDMSDHPSRP
jgi:integrase